MGLVGLEEVIFRHIQIKLDCISAWKMAGERGKLIGLRNN